MISKVKDKVSIYKYDKYAYDANGDRDEENC